MYCTIRDSVHVPPVELHVVPAVVLAPAVSAFLGKINMHTVEPTTAAAPTEPHVGNGQDRRPRKRAQGAAAKAQRKAEIDEAKARHEKLVVGYLDGVAKCLATAVDSKMPLSAVSSRIALPSGVKGVKAALMHQPHRFALHEPLPGFWTVCLQPADTASESAGDATPELAAAAEASAPAMSHAGKVHPPCQGRDCSALLLARVQEADDLRMRLAAKDESVRRRLEQTLRSKWPAARVQLFGSAASGLRVSGSDIDACLTVPDEQGLHEDADSRRPTSRRMIEQLGSLLRSARGGRSDGSDTTTARGGALYASIVPIVHARVPIVKAVDRVAQIACDVVPHASLAVINSQLLASYGRLEPRCRQLILLVKMWASARRVTSAMHSYLSSYAHCVTVLHFCLHGCEPPLLVDLQGAALVKEMADRWVDGFDVRVCDDLDAARAQLNRIQRAHPTPNALNSPLSTLLHGYFRHMLEHAGGGTHSSRTMSLHRLQLARTEWGGKQQVVKNGVSIEVCAIPLALAATNRFAAPMHPHASARLAPTRTHPHDWHPHTSTPGYPRMPYVAQDPFETCLSIKPHNLGTPLTGKTAATLASEWRRAMALLDDPNMLPSEVIKELFRSGPSPERRLDVDGAAYCEREFIDYCNGPQIEPGGHSGVPRPVGCTARWLALKFLPLAPVSCRRAGGGQWAMGLRAPHGGLMMPPVSSCQLGPPLRLVHIGFHRCNFRTCKAKEQTSSAHTVRARVPACAAARGGATLARSRSADRANQRRPRAKKLGSCEIARSRDGQGT